MPKTDNPGDLRIASLQVGFDNVGQLIGGHGLVGGWLPLRIEHMKANVILKKFGHQPIHRTSRSRDEPQGVGQFCSFVRALSTASTWPRIRRTRNLSFFFL
jgi:hypothetical protein